MTVAASLRTGLEAVNQIDRVNPDVAVLDIEMPELDGIAALPQLLAKKRDLVIIMASTLTRRNAEISFKALSLGAADYIPKPESTREATAAETFHHDLIQKIGHLGARARRRRRRRDPPWRRPQSGHAKYRSSRSLHRRALPLARRPFSTLRRGCC
jgi:two-component system chemotaxis response regulator CheB